MFWKTWIYSVSSISHHLRLRSSKYHYFVLRRHLVLKPYFRQTSSWLSSKWVFLVIGHYFPSLAISELSLSSRPDGDSLFLFLIMQLHQATGHARRNIFPFTCLFLPVWNITVLNPVILITVFFHYKPCKPLFLSKGPVILCCDGTDKSETGVTLQITTSLCYLAQESFALCVILESYKMCKWFSSHTRETTWEQKSSGEQKLTAYSITK